MDGGLLADVIEHCFQKAPECSLILLRDVAVLLDNLSLLNTEPSVQRTLPKQNEPHIYAQRRDSQQVCTVRIANSPLVTALGIAVDPAGLGQILLAEAQSNPFFA